MSNKLRILRLTLSIGETSAPYNQFSLAARQRHDITIATLWHSEMSPPSEIKYHESEGGTLRGYMRLLYRLLRDNEYDVLHAHTPHVACLFLLTRLLLWRQRIPPTVFTVHNSFHSYDKRRTWLMLIPVFLFFDAIVCCSHASYDSIPRVYRWLAGKRLTTIPNGVDVERVTRTLQTLNGNDKDDTFTVTAIGRLINIKNPLTALHAFEEIAQDDSKLVWIGAGELDSDVRRYASSLGIEPQVELTGLIPRESVYAKLADSDLYVSTSYGEGLPIATLEAMSCQCPVILSDIEPHREITKGVDFIPLVKPDDVGGFAREIGRFYTMPDAEREQIGRKCQQLAAEKFSLATMHDGYDRIYHTVIKN